MAELPAQTLTGKVAIVTGKAPPSNEQGNNEFLTTPTGSARGLGASMALDLAKRGANVVITYTSPSSASTAGALVSQIAALPNAATAISVRANMAELAAAETIVSATRAAFGGPVDILVNNAAVQVTRGLRDVEVSDYEAVYEVNVRGVILLTQAVLKCLRAPGRIVNISSVGARQGFAELSLYCSSKAAIEGLTRAWAGELGADGTTVNAVAPGPVQSEMLESIPPQIVQSQKDGTPVQKRVGQPDEISRVVCWLASEEASWVSGQVINVSGGWSMY